MAISNYATLVAAVADWLNRTGDSALEDQIPNFIQLAESTMKRRLRRSSTTLTTQTSNALADGYLPAGASEMDLPVDFDEPRVVVRATSTSGRSGNVNVGTLAQLADSRQIKRSGTISLVAFVGSTMKVAPEQHNGTILEITYFQKLVPLTEDEDETDLLTEYPDVYLYGALLEAAPWLEHDERVPLWQARFDTACAEINDKRQSQELAAQLQPARLPMVFG